MDRRLALQSADLTQTHKNALFDPGDFKPFILFLVTVAGCDLVDNFRNINNAGLKLEKKEKRFCCTVYHFDIV